MLLDARDLCEAHQRNCNLNECFLTVPHVLYFEAIKSDFEMRSSRQGVLRSQENQEVIVVVSKKERRWKCIVKDWVRRLKAGKGMWNKGVKRWGKRLTLLRKGKWKSERLLVWEGKDWWQGCVWGSQEGTVNYLNEKDKEVWERELSEE